MSSEKGISEIIGVLLIIILLIAIAAIVSAMWFGWTGNLLSKTPYLKVNISAYNIGGDPKNQSIEIFHYNGDVLSLQTGGNGTPANITLLLPDGSSANVIPSPGVKTFSPGQYLYISKKSGIPAYNISSTPPPKADALYAGKYTVNIVDAKTHVLIVTQGVTITGQVNPTPTPTVLPTISPTPVHYPGFTVEAWIKWSKNPTPVSDDERWATIVVDGTNDNNRRYHLQHDQNNAHFEFQAQTATSGGQVHVWSTTSPVTNVWYYITGVYNQTDPISNKKLRIYVNGVRETSIDLTGGNLKGPVQYQFGGPTGINWGSTGLRKFNGTIDGSRLKTYEYVLTDSEIQGHYALGHP